MSTASGRDIGSAEDTQKAQIIEQGEAWEYYTQPRKEEGAWPLRNYLRSDLLYYVFEALGRPLDLSELKMLVGFDGDMQRCAVEDREFQPVFWVDISNKGFLELLEVTKSVEEALKDSEPLVFGCWYYSRKKRSWLPVSGKPWFFIEKTRKWVPDRRSALVDARFQHPKNHWGKPTCEAVRLNKVEQDRRERKQRQDEKRASRAQDLFG